VTRYWPLIIAESVLTAHAIEDGVTRDGRRSPPNAADKIAQPLEKSVKNM
jgi:hypothetical protein